MAQVLDVTGFLKYAVQSAAMFETRFNAVERLMAYVTLPQEAARQIKDTQCAPQLLPPLPLTPCCLSFAAFTQEKGLGVITTGHVSFEDGFVPSSCTWAPAGCERLEGVPEAYLEACTYTRVALQLIQ